MAVDLSNKVYGGMLIDTLFPAASSMTDAYGGVTDTTASGWTTAATGWFADPAAAQAIVDQVKSGAITQKQALDQLGPMINQDAFYNYVNQAYKGWDASKKATDASWGSDAAAIMKGVGFVAGAGALGGAFSGAGAMGTDTILGGAENFGTLAGTGGGSAAEVLSGIAGSAGTGGAGSTVTAFDDIAGGILSDVGGTYTGGTVAGTAATVAGAAGTVASGAGLASTIAKILDGTATAEDYLKLLGPAMSIGSGVYGITQAANLSTNLNTDVKAALDDSSGARGKVIAAADPWTASGGRAVADTQLQSLMKDPSQVAATDPAYKLRIQAAQRAMGSYGQGSGKMAVAGADASTSWLDNRLASLAGLENLGNPVGAQQAGIAQTQAELDAARLKFAGAAGANSLAGQSMASMAFGVTQATGGNTAIPQDVQTWLRAQGVRI